MLISPCMLPAVGVGGTLDSAPLGCVSPRHFRPTGGGREQGGERRGNRALLPAPWGPVQMWLDLTVSRLPLLSARTDNKISRWFVVEIKWIKAPMDLNGLKRRAGPHAEWGLVWEPVFLKRWNGLEKQRRCLACSVYPLNFLPKLLLKLLMSA